MCGITGFADFNKKLSIQHLEKACNTLQHRGPDDKDAVVQDVTAALIGLGHRRLSILDISSSGHQPMYSDDRSVSIIVNGEIYNFKEIRKALEEKGHSFKSGSDTEVIIKAYQQHGMQCLQQFIGMFAFVLYDATRQKLFLVRDRAGVKPLYYSFTDDCLLFASELKAFHQYPCFKKEIDTAAVSVFFKYGYIKAPHSIFKETYKLLAGHFAELDLATSQLQMHQYWNVQDYYDKPAIAIDEKEALTTLDELFASAFQYRMISDVPVGLFLSGGYDSSMVAAVLQKNNRDKIKTFTIGFSDDAYNEAGYAKKIAAYLGTDHREYYCTSKEALEIIPLLPFYYDEPFGDSSAIPTILVSRFARQQVTVALSADGGDELFAGYTRYDQLDKLHKLQQYAPTFLRKAVASALKSLPVKDPFYKKLAFVLAASGEADLADKLSSHFTDQELNHLLMGAVTNNAALAGNHVLPAGKDFINRLLAADYKTYLTDDILTKVDRAAMSVGLENREPLLDHRIIEWVAQLPASLKYHNGNKKYLLKKLAHQYLPQHLMNRPKMGFAIPVKEWLKTDLKQYLFRYVNSTSINKHGLIDAQYAERIRDQYLAGQKGYETKIWLLLMFQMWWEKWME